MKFLVVYYSRTGNTAIVAKELAEVLNCDREEIHDTKNRKGFLRWFGAGSDGMVKRTTVIEKIIYDPSTYDFVIIGTPIWVNMTPAIRTYLKENSAKFKKVAFFCTMGGTGGKPIFDEMTEITGKEPVATMELKEKDIKNGEYIRTVKEFVAKLTL